MESGAAGRSLESDGAARFLEPGVARKEGGCAAVAAPGSAGAALCSPRKAAAVSLPGRSERPASFDGRDGDLTIGSGTAVGEGAAGTDADPALTRAPWPWKHAIVHRQARRMRSNEVHYLDHPVIGVVVKVRPASEEHLPLERDQEAATAQRERHGLPLDYLEIEADYSPDN